MYRARFLSSTFGITLAIATILGFTSFISLAHAQLSGGSGSDPLTIDLSPTYPAPYQTVTVTPSSTTFDISGATVSVTLNGTAFYKGSGGAPINIPIGGPGKNTTISISVTSGGQTTKKTLVINPADVALVEEPISTTHPFYEGIGLVAPQGGVRLIAIPDLRSSSGKSLDPSTLVYTWKLGDQILTADSGIGKSVLNAVASERYRDSNVTVTVASPDGSIIAQSGVTVSPVDPVTLLYKDDPLLGPLYDTALGSSLTMSGTEDTYLGVPYYFSHTPVLSWTVNGVASGADNSITVRSTGNGTGSAVVGFSANDTSSTQIANSTMSVNFGQKPTGFLGL